MLGWSDVFAVDMYQKGVIASAGVVYFVQIPRAALRSPRTGRLDEDPLQAVARAISESTTLQ